VLEFNSIQELNVELVPVIESLSKSAPYWKCVKDSPVPYPLRLQTKVDLPWQVLPFLESLQGRYWRDRPFMWQAFICLMLTMAAEQIHVGYTTMEDAADTFSREVGALAGHLKGMQSVRNFG
jgi:hypothetical protein